MGNLTNFYLVGHSFGGYLSGLYASMYHQHIRKLLCISPIGFDIEPENADPFAIACCRQQIRSVHGGRSRELRKFERLIRTTDTL